MLGPQFTTRCKLFLLSSLSLSVFTATFFPFLHVIHATFKFLVLAMLAFMNSNLAFPTAYWQFPPLT